MKSALFDKRGMAVCKYIFVLILILFFIVYCCILSSEVKPQNFGEGDMIVKFYGRAYGYNNENGEIIYFDNGDLFTPYQNDDSFFVPLIVYQAEASQGNTCGRGCLTNTDCPTTGSYANGECVNGRCQELGWCAATAQTEYALIGIENIEIFMVPVIDFPMESDFTYIGATTVALVDYPAKLANVYTLQQLLNMANVTIAQAAETGGVMRINCFIECDLSFKTCSQTYNVDLMNSGQELTPLAGVTSAAWASMGIPMATGNNEYLQLMTGLRFYTVVNGVGFYGSVNAWVMAATILFNISVFCAVICDLIFENCVANKKVLAQKYGDSEDFGDMKDRLEEVRKQREMQYLDMDDDDGENQA